MKKHLILLLVVIVGITACACGGIKVARGTVNGNVYSSEFSGITFTKPDSWVFATDEEIAQTLNIGADMLDQNNFEKAVSEAASTYDMMVTDPATNSNVQISYENLAVTDSEDMTVDEYLDTFKKQLDAQDVIDYEYVGSEKTTLCGEEYTCITLNATYNGVKMVQACYARKIDNLIVNVIITAVNTDVANIEAMFS